MQKNFISHQLNQITICSAAKVSTLELKHHYQIIHNYITLLTRFFLTSVPSSDGDSDSIECMFRPQTQKSEGINLYKDFLVADDKDYQLVEGVLISFHLKSISCYLS